MRETRTTLSAVTAFIGFSILGFSMLTAAAYADCTVLKRDPLTLIDRQLYYSTDAGQSWQEYVTPQPQLAGQTLNFTYVIRERSTVERVGVVIIKSARNVLASEEVVPRRNKNVELVREAAAFENGTCGLLKPFGAQRISAESYDDYHDLNRSVSQQSIIEDFHFKYATRRGGCRDTNSLNRDTHQRRTNRGQFSFNSDVVMRGLEPQIVEAATTVATNLFGIQPALAERRPMLANQRVELQQYRGSRNIPTCVHFRLSVPAPDGFVRINDLEALALDGSGLRYLRVDEKHWSLTR